MGPLDGRAFIITGGGRGVGRAAAEQLARAGAALLLNDLGCTEAGEGTDPRVSEEAATELRGLGAKVVADSEDVASAGATERLVTRAIEHLGRLDGVLACAGFRKERRLLRLGAEELDRVLDVHLKANILLLQAAAKSFIERDTRGSIVLTVSPLAFFGAARKAAVLSAHAGVVGLVRTAALELRKHQIRVNAIAPTARTRLTEDLPLFRGVSESSMEPAHVAPLTEFLLSERSQEVSGEILGVAGGRIYAIGARETTGAFAEGGAFTPDAIEAAWQEIVRS